MEILYVILTSVLSVTALFIITKIMGHKQISQLDFFDYISGITIGSIAAELATELEKLWKPLIAIIIYGCVSVMLSLITNKAAKSRKYINGTPTIIMDNGKIYRENMKKAKIDISEFMVMCRQQGYFHLNAIQTAVFEHNGQLSILPVSSERPIVPSDLNVTLPSDSIDIEVIMDGRILESNLKRSGLDINWLNKQLKEQGYKNAKDIFLGICDKNKKLSVYPIK